MALITARATLTIQGIAKRVLDKHFSRKSGDVNIRKATRAASLGKEGSREFEKDRKCLEIAYGYRKHTGVYCMQEATVDRLAGLLERIEPGTRHAVERAILTDRARQESIQILKSTSWAQLPSGPELVKIKPQIEEPYGLLLDEFEQWASEQGHHKWTVAVSILRILAPLACWIRTSGIKRGWHELSPKKKRQFIQWGIGREKIMLGKDPDYLRASDIWPDDAAASELSEEMRDIVEFLDGGLTDSKDLAKVIPEAERLFTASEQFASQKYREKKKS